MNSHRKKNGSNLSVKVNPGRADMRHRECGGSFGVYRITSHEYCYMQCTCGYILGGTKEAQKVAQLKKMKALPYVRRYA